MNTNQDNDQEIKRPKQRFRKIVLSWSVIVIILITLFGILIRLGYEEEWTGFNVTPDANGGFRPGKYLWDWMELLIIPIVGAISV